MKNIKPIQIKNTWTEKNKTYSSKAELYKAFLGINYPNNNLVHKLNWK